MKVDENIRGATCISDAIFLFGDQTVTTFLEDSVDEATTDHCLVRLFYKLLFCHAHIVHCMLTRLLFVFSDKEDNTFHD